MKHFHTLLAAALALLCRGAYAQAARRSKTLFGKRATAAGGKVRLQLPAYGVTVAEVL